MLDTADNLHKGLLKESLGNVNDKMNVHVFHYSEVEIEKYKAELSDQSS